MCNVYYIGVLGEKDVEGRFYWWEGKEELVWYMVWCYEGGLGGVWEGGEFWGVKRLWFEGFVCVEERSKIEE